MKYKVKFKPEVRDMIANDGDRWVNVCIDGSSMSYGRAFLSVPYFTVTKANGLYYVVDKGELYHCLLCVNHVEPYREFNITIEDELFEL